MLNKEVYEKLTAFTQAEKELHDSLKDPKGKKIKHTVGKYIKGQFEEGEYFVIEKHTRFFPVPEHYHDFIEIMYVINGKVKQKIKGKEITLKKGEVMFLNQHISHEIGMTGEEDIMINFIIKPEFFDYIISLIRDKNPISKFFLSSIYDNVKKGEYLYFHVSEVKRVQTTLEEIIEEIYRDTPIKNVRIQFLMGLLVIDLIDNIPKLETYSEKGYDGELLAKILEYIDKNYTDGSLKEVAAELNQPNYKISKFMKEVTGKTFQEFILEKRLEKSKELLINTDYSISEIIREIGYENNTYFYKVFKGKYKMSPKEFREKIPK